MSSRIWIALATVGLCAAAAGWLAGRWTAPGAPAGPGTDSSAGAGPCAGGAEALYWKAPMDPTYVRDQPGKSPMGMDLVPVCPGEQEGAASGRIRIDPAIVQSIGVRTAVVEQRSLARKIRAVGRVDYDERLVAHVHTKVQGWVEKLYVEYAGQLVERGHPLLQIYSPELVSTQEELLLAARYRTSTGHSSFEDVAEGGRALFEATRRRLELWDISERDIQRLLDTGRVRKNLTLYAPTSGVVTHLMVRKGMEVSPGTNLYTIADLSRVWLYADVYEYELPWVSVGQRGVVDLSYLPGKAFEGEVTYVYPFLDPTTRTARVRLELPNPDLILKPDMFANVTIETEARPRALVVSEAAVIRSGRRSLAIVALGEGRFEPREIELGLDSGDGWLEVTSGLEAGERIVTSGQFLIDSESKLQEAVQKLSSPSGDEGADHDHSRSAREAAGHEADPRVHEGAAVAERPSSHEGHAPPPPAEARAGQGAMDPRAGHEQHGVAEPQSDPGDAGAHAHEMRPGE
jgi:Cu(I)/Ag(I) efflux system membrane fusion protein/cobalt-zinc-cadmium efflux system membrane fusion protein